MHYDLKVEMIPDEFVTGFMNGIMNEQHEKKSSCKRQLLVPCLNHCCLSFPQPI